MSPWLDWHLNQLGSFDDMSPIPKEDVFVRIRKEVGVTNRRPILTHLNADLTWLMSFPTPESQRGSFKKAYFHILCDPWCLTTAVDIGGLHRQDHVEDPAFNGIAEVVELISVIEKAAPQGAIPNEIDASLDAVVISHSNAEHCNKNALLEVSPSVPVIANKMALSTLKSWKHFSVVDVAPNFVSDNKGESPKWNSANQPLIPSWVSVWHVPPLKGRYALRPQHHSMLITYSAEANTEAEAVLNCPHGLAVQDAEILADAKGLTTLALLHR